MNLPKKIATMITTGKVPNISRVNSTAQLVSQCFDNYDCTGSARAIEKFVDECNLADQIEVGRGFVRKKFKSLEKLVREQPEIVQRYRNVFRGTIFENQTS